MWLLNVRGGSQIVILVAISHSTILKENVARYGGSVIGVLSVCVRCFKKKLDLLQSKPNLRNEKY